MSDGASRFRKRFIPAPAGNTPRTRPIPARTTVHPRACGEHLLHLLGNTSKAGSSPRLRGTPPMPATASGSWRFIPVPAGNTWGGQDNCTGRRFIPAPAGNTRGPTGQITAASVHPRACGEHSAVPRFVPLRAVHPRACGEHNPVEGFSTPRIGSSPRLRGPLGEQTSAMLVVRFIPAPAGNTKTRCSMTASQPVHPRACGEHIAARRMAAGCGGSSPRLRGTPPLPAAGTRPLRFIPAPAGNTDRLLCSRPH